MPSHATKLQKGPCYHLHRAPGYGTTSGGAGNESVAGDGAVGGANVGVGAHAGVSELEWAQYMPHLLSDSEPNSGTNAGAGAEAGADTNSIRGNRLGAQPECVWTDKLEMVNTAAAAITEQCILFQVDADELWSVDAIVRAHQIMTGVGVGVGDAADSNGGFGDASDSSPTSPRYESGPGSEPGSGPEPGPEPESRPGCIRVHCHFFVGDTVVASTPNGYGHSDRCV